MSTKLTIGKVASRSGLGIETIRYYERENILSKAQRDPNNDYRIYDESIFKRLSFIVKAKKLGFTLKETVELLDLEESTSCSSMQTRIDLKLANVQEKIRSLKNLKKLEEV